MENLQPIFHEYQLYPHSITLVKSVWRVETDRGTFAIKKVATSSDHLNFIFQTLSYLKRSGLDAVTPFVLARGGQPFIPFEDGFVYLTPWVEGRSGKDLIEELDWIPDAFAQLGRMHRLSIGKHTDQMEFLYKEGVRLQESWNQRIDRLHEFRDMVSKRLYPSPIDAVFMANIDQLMEMSIQAAGRLEEWLRSAQEQEEIRLSFCHGRLNPDHIILGDQLSFINFDRANLDFPARDLSYLIRFLAARMGSGAMVEDWLNRYIKENPLSNDEIEILNISLQFPALLVQFLERYYTQQLKGKWTELTLTRRFEKMLDEQNLLTHF